MPAAVSISTTEPILAPIRRILPPTGMFDLSPLIVLLILGAWLFVTPWIFGFADGAAGWTTDRANRRKRITPRAWIAPTAAARANFSVFP